MINVWVFIFSILFTTVGFVLIYHQLNLGLYQTMKYISIFVLFWLIYKPDVCQTKQTTTLIILI